MNERVFNFYSGPAALPEAVLERARGEIFSVSGSGMSVMEISHRSDTFVKILESAQSRLGRLLGVPQGYHVLFLQGGASLQFSMAPMNFIGRTGSADYVVTGAWSKKAAGLAGQFGSVRVIYSSPEDGPARTPAQEEISNSPDAAYLHYVSNETIDGVEFHYDVDGYGVPVICDASSDILSREIDVGKYAMIYAGAQKNIGPSGVTVVIMQDEFLRTAAPDIRGVLSYRSFADNASMPNTPNTWGIYIIDLVCEWLEQEGGVGAIAARNRQKAEMLYSAIDNSDGFYSNNVERPSRSLMNVVFRLPDERLENEFCEQAKRNGLVGLKGHRSVGGIRASIYNAFPIKGVEVLIDFMNDFARTRG